MSDPPDRDPERTHAGSQGEAPNEPGAGRVGEDAAGAGVDIDADHDHQAVRRLVKRAFSGDLTARETPDILHGVQRRLRKRSRGKFFADGWSTSQARQAYVLVALVTLLLVAMAYYALSPIDFR